MLKLNYKDVSSCDFIIEKLENTTINSYIKFQYGITRRNCHTHNEYYFAYFIFPFMY